MDGKEWNDTEDDFQRRNTVYKVVAQLRSNRITLGAYKDHSEALKVASYAAGHGCVERKKGIVVRVYPVGEIRYVDIE